MSKLNHREKRKKLITSILLIAVISVASLSIAYAALSETLTISGSGTINAADWDISITNAADYTNKATGDATFTTPTVSGTTISYNVTMKKPGDSVTLYFDVKNSGEVNGKITSIINSPPVCTSETGDADDEKLICDNLEITMTYSNGTTIQTGDIVNTESYTCYNGYNYGYNKATIKVVVKLKDSMNSLSGSKVTLSNMKHDIIYTLSTDTCTTQSACFVAGTKVLTQDGYKNIEDIKVEEYIYAMNLDTNKYELKKVLQKFNSLTSEIYKIHVADHIIETTSRHEFYIIDKGWIRAAEIKVGDKLSSKENIDTTITKIEIEELNERLPVYNMEVEGHHNYLITEDELLVHNAQSIT